ncbi:MAG: hypothetical protein ACK5X3_21465 [Pseudomonadota bacterium]|jgi:hypothetical protein
MEIIYCSGDVELPYFWLCQRINPRPNQIPHHQEGPGASELHKERAAIMEHDDGLPRSEAEQLAKQPVDEMRRAKS